MSAARGQGCWWGSPWLALVHTQARASGSNYKTVPGQPELVPPGASSAWLRERKAIILQACFEVSRGGIFPLDRIFVGD